jgi:hypothetical protein
MDPRPGLGYGSITAPWTRPDRMIPPHLHADFARHADEPRSSERNLRLTFAVVLALAPARRRSRASDAGH